MSTATLHHDRLSTRPAVPRIAQNRSSARGLLARLWNGVSKANRRREEAEISRYIQLHGGKVTDSLERDIERRFIFGRF